MKIVVYGPNKRTGVLRGSDIVDISGAYAKYLREKEGNANAYVVKPLDFAEFKRLMDEMGYFWLQWNRSPERTA